jgi:hypothetical protein
MNITDSQADYVKELTQKLQNAGIRVKADLRNEKIGFKIREHTLRRVPYMLVCGDKEVESGKVAVRTRRGKDLGSLDVNEVIEKLRLEIRSRSLQQLEAPESYQQRNSRARSSLNRSGRRAAWYCESERSSGKSRRVRSRLSRNQP